MKKILFVILFVPLISISQISFKVSDDTYSPDITVKIGSDVYYPDITIKLVKSGTVDYVIYNEKNYTSMADIISALLPVIHKYTDYQNDALNKLFQ